MLPEWLFREIRLISPGNVTFSVSDIFHSIALLPHLGEQHETRSCFVCVRDGPTEAGNLSWAHLVTLGRIHGPAAGLGNPCRCGGAPALAVGLFSRTGKPFGARTPSLTSGVISRTGEPPGARTYRTWQCAACLDDHSAEPERNRSTNAAGHVQPQGPVSAAD
jgi:hypothetical protein